MPDSARARTKVNKSLKNYPLTSIVGLFGMLIAAHFYPPLDMNPVMGLALALFFIPMLAHIVLSVQKRLSSHAALIRRMYVLAGIVLVTLAVLLFLNGALDKYPSMQAQTSVVRKSASRGRYSTGYSLIVTPSWRPGRVEERLEVNGATFSMVRTGEPVRVVVHRGVFWLPWFSSVLPE